MESILASLASLVMLVFIYLKLDGFMVIPGDLGDARLVNYFLENFYQYFFGSARSLWDLNFFYPFPFVLGFSENLFGTGFIYSIFRGTGFNSDTAFQLWFSFGYIFNFLASYYCFRRLGLKAPSSFLGALIFSFALPTSAHSPHAQLHYRFACALAITYTFLWVREEKIDYFFWSLFWLVIQFYCGIYIGFFTLLFISVSFLYAKIINKNFHPIYRLIKIHFYRRKFIFFIVLLVVLASLLLLFFPYLQVKRLYGFDRYWGDIAPQLPRLQSYLMSVYSPIWGEISKGLPVVPMAHEHQMFMGATIFMLLFYGLWVGIFGSKNKNPIFFGMLLSMVTCILMTLSVNGFSFWYILHRLPLFSAIRAITRIDQVLLFPVGYICASGLDLLKSQKFTKLILVILASCLVFCEWFITPYPWVSQKAEWRSRVSMLDARLPENLNAGSVLFVAQGDGPAYANEIDVMWVALNRGLPTLNGYSGNLPLGFKENFGRDCRELENRMKAFSSFADKNKLEVNRVKPYKNILSIGFDCSHQ
jgi:hypothetical protein